ncbi:hypothetical protein ACOMHN_037991 [Nucella lapillus]
MCDFTVTWDDKGVLCDNCGLWFHTSCQHISLASYDIMNESVNADKSWNCDLCGGFNKSQTAFDLYGLDEDGVTANESCSTDMSLPAESVDFDPLHTSTPSRAARQDKQKKRPLRLLNVNIRKSTSKTASFKNLLEGLKPDVVVGTETWLDPSIYDGEFITDGYNVMRKDRTHKRGGGVLIAVRDNLQAIVVDNLDVDCEILWVKIFPKTKGQRSTHICAYYRPNVSDVDSYNKFEVSVLKALKLRSTNLIIAGDLNFPGMHWPTDTIKPSSPYPTLHQSFMNFLNDNGLKQMVMEPTREENFLDLVITNTPHLVPRVQVHIGISDHEAVYFEYNSKVQIKNGVPRPIPLYSKANWDQLRADMKGLHSKIAEKPTSSAEELWSSFKEGLQSSIAENIPHKTTRRRAGQPWITTDISKLTNQRDRKYKQMKKKGNFELKTDLLHLRSKVQREIRRAELSYIGKLFEPTVEETTKTLSTKRLWTYLKHKRTSSSGMTGAMAEWLKHRTSDPKVTGSSPGAW